MRIYTNLIIIIDKNPFGFITTSIKWGTFKYAWYGETSTYWAMRFCSPWFDLAKRIKIIYKEAIQCSQ